MGEYLVLAAEDHAPPAAKPVKSETVVEVTLYRLCKKFRMAIRKQIACTVESEAEIEGEFNHLLRVL